MAARCPGSVPLFSSFLDTAAVGFRTSGCRRGQRVAAGAAWLATHHRPISSTCSYPPRPARRCYTTEPSTTSEAREEDSTDEPVQYPTSRLNPLPSDYAAASFADKALLTVHAGGGGNGCISFLRELFLPEGPPNGGDGGHGGSVYIQAVPGETSLHKIARRRVMRAGRGKHGQGAARNGQRGDDLIITVPVGTVITEVSRIDPLEDEAEEVHAHAMAERRKRKLANIAADDARKAAQAKIKVAKAARAAMAMQPARRKGEQEDEPEEYERRERRKRKEEPPEPLTDEELERQQEKKLEAEQAEEAKIAWLRKKWVVYPGLSSTEVKNIEYPRLPRRDRVVPQPPAPVYLDLSRPTPEPILLAAGGVGGLGNPHFVARSSPRPVVATKGEHAVSMTIQMELKLLADVGLVGLPNAGKSTLLRAISNSRARVGSWAFTTLQPNIGTVVLDNNRGKPLVPLGMMKSTSEQGREATRTRFTIADIPGLIEGAHLDKGLGIEFLRHVERAGVLAFVIDMGAGDSIEALKALWREVGLYARFREEEEQQRVREAEVAQLERRGETQWGKPRRSRKQASEHDYAGPLSHHGEYSSLQSSISMPELAIAGKPWFVVATKSDLPGAEANFQRLQAYLTSIESFDEEHPSGLEDAWVDKLAAIPVSAIHGHGVDSIIHWTVGLLDQ